MPARLSDRRILLAALAAGILWGFLMALVAWRGDGTEVVLMQGWILAAAFGLGRLAGTPRLGALAGLAVVSGAVWTYELLPGWGLEATLLREGASPAELEFLAARLDADDIVLVSTLMIGALVGLGGGLRAAGAPRTQDAHDEAPAAVAPTAMVEPPAPLWAGFGAPQAPSAPAHDPAPAAPPPQSFAEPPPPRDSRAIRTRILSAALLLACLATDFMLDRVFDFYTDPQATVAVVFLLAGIVGTTLLARRLTAAAVLVGVVLALAFGAVQQAEYDERRPPEASFVR